VQANKLEIKDPDFTASLTTCGAKPVLLPAENIKRARDYFRTGFKDGPAAGEDPPYIDSDGLIQFIVAGELVSDPEVMKKIIELKDILIALTSIVTGYINDTYPNDPEKRKDPLVWFDVMSYLPLMGPFKYVEQSYTRAIKGVKIATEFIDFIMEVLVSEGDALKSFQQFLEKQGEAIKFGIENNKDGYKTVTAGVVVEALKVGEATVYIPKLKMYAIHFDRKNSSFTSACVSVEIIDIDFKYQNTTSVFDYQALVDPVVKKDFDDFLTLTRKAQIGRATTFFDRNFPKKP
jgi:Virulence factor Evf